MKAVPVYATHRVSPDDDKVRSMIRYLIDKIAGGPGDIIIPCAVFSTRIYLRCRRSYWNKTSGLICELSINVGSPLSKKAG